MRTLLRFFAFAVGGIVLLVALAAGLGAWSNRKLPAGPAVLDRIDAMDKIRLAETLHLKASLGEGVWPGWGRADFPVILWNREYSFLIGHSSPPEGWEPVVGDSFGERPYYRRRSHNPQNFAIPMGDRWAVSMGTKWEADAFLMKMFRDVLPSWIETFFPYRLLIQPSEVQMTGLLHESFHAYQAEVAQKRLEAAERAHALAESYWAADVAMRGDWKNEIRLLEKALTAKTGDEVAGLAGEFLAVRELRRSSSRLDSALVEFERQLEWEEGLAKYVELAIWREAHESKQYKPLLSAAEDPAFKEYAGYAARWSHEVGQLRRLAARPEEIRFYYTGMAQAMMLDRLLPEWKLRALADGVSLESLVDEASRDFASAPRDSGR